MAEKENEMTISHGHARNGSISAELRAWYEMKERCYRKTNKKYQAYVGRGIVVCPIWQKSFIAFFRHIGPRPSSKHSLDRIDVNGNYEPGNVRWATAKQQQRNRRNNIIVKFNGTDMSLAEAAERSGLQYDLLKKRLQIGWPRECIFTPAQKRGPSRKIVSKP